MSPDSVMKKKNMKSLYDKFALLYIILIIVFGKMISFYDQGKFYLSKKYRCTKYSLVVTTS